MNSLLALGHILNDNPTLYIVIVLACVYGWIWADNRQKQKQKQKLFEEAYRKGYEDGIRN